jgi:hypothetical protein
MYVNSLKSRGLDASFAEGEAGKDAPKDPPKPAAAAPRR